MLQKDLTFYQLSVLYNYFDGLNKIIFRFAFQQNYSFVDYIAYDTLEYEIATCIIKR